MIISGVQKFTLLDFPGKMACIVFTPGCNFRCGYCHNPEFVLPEKIAGLSKSFIREEAFLRFLEERKGLLDGVVITGGEPTLMVDLLRFMGTVKSMGFLVKLDTNGNRPDVVREAISRGVVDYIALDIKTMLGDYKNLSGKMACGEKIGETMALLKAGGVDYELRSTLIKEVHSRDILNTMALEIKGAKRLYLQSFRPGHTLDAKYGEYNAFNSEELGEIAELFKPFVDEVKVR